METTILKTKKSTSVPKGTKLNPYRKPDVPPKVNLGGGRRFGWVSDTLFDEDLKG